MTGTTTALAFRNVTKRYGDQKPAVDGVTFDVPGGCLFGLIGESGSGKTTLARIAAGLVAPDWGQVLVAGKRRTGNDLHRRVQFVFQNPRGSLNPRQTVGRLLETPLRHILGQAATSRQARIAELLDSVQLSGNYAELYPHELSGGEAQRVALARALAAEPEIILLDEPTSALDVLIQRDILSLLTQLHGDGLTMLLISHDLAVVNAVCSDIAILEHGRLVEHGPTRGVFTAPQHRYTRDLLAAARRLGPAV